MDTIDLKSFFAGLNYDWHKDEERLSKICYYTKTREDPNRQEFQLTRGCEQPFLLKAIVEGFGVRRFFEFGTGRGTASYSLALCPGVDEVLTTDILEWDQKFPTAIGHVAVEASIKDFYDLIPYAEKSKVRFQHVIPLLDEVKGMYQRFDACFIDADHTDEKLIRAHFDLCEYMTKPNGLFIFDDYGPERFAVKRVVDRLIVDRPRLHPILIEFHGHLFGGEPEQNEGLVILSNRIK